MRRGSRWLPLLLLLTVLAAACGATGDATTSTGGETPTTTGAGDGLTLSPGVLTVGSDIPHEPFVDYDPSDPEAVIGFDADLITGIATRLGLTVEWVDTDFDTILDRLAEGRFDVVIAAMSITPEREHQAAFTAGYYVAGDERYGIAVDPTRSELLTRIGAALAAMLADGTYQAIYDTWFEAPEGSVLYEAPPEAAVGTVDHPIRVLFVPSVPIEDLLEGVEVFTDALADATGLFFEAAVPNSYAATVSELCDSPEDTVAFLPAEAYFVADELCGVMPALAALRFGYPGYWTEIVVARDAATAGLEDLAGLTWAYPDAASVSGYLIPSGMLAAAGVVPGAATAAGGHTPAVAAVYAGTADFATVRFSPNVDLEGNTVWDGTLAGADIPDDLVAECAVVEGDLVCGTLKPRDARRGLRDDAPDVIQKLRILAVSDLVPNDALTFSVDFPADMRAQIVAAARDYATDDPDGFLGAFAVLAWDGLVDIDESAFDGARVLLTALGYGIDDL